MTGSRSETRTAAYAPAVLGTDRHQTWRTPPEFFAALHAEFRFTLDGAATADDALLPRYRSPDDLTLSWAGERVFANPPWTDIPPFVALATTADLAVLLVPARTNTRWFNDALALGARPRFFRGRPQFAGHDRRDAHSSPFDCLLLVWERPR